MGEMIREHDTNIHTLLTQRLEAKKKEHLYRQLSPRQTGVNLVANDYHGFSRFPIQSAAPSGAGGSRLLGANHPEHTRLEAAIADALGHEAALVFPSGFQCHQSVLETVLSDYPFVVIADHLNHASLQSGVARSQAPLYRFRHNDVHDCRRKISAARRRFPDRTPMIVAESIHSMDGECAPLADLIALKKESGAWLVLDEAHAIGVCGPHALGLGDELEAASEIDIILGTFSKGLGLQGAFVAAARPVINTIVNFAKGFIYTTALSPAIADTVAARLAILAKGPAHLARLRARIREFAALSPIFSKHAAISPIFAIMFSSIPAMLSARDTLAKADIHVGAVRPPTYPKPMLRVCVNSDLDDPTWRKALNIFCSLIPERE